MDQKRSSQLGLFLILMLVMAGMFWAAHTITATLRARSSVLGSASLALKHLKEAQNLVGEKNFLGSQEQFKYAEENFIHARQDVSDLGVFLNSVLSITGKGKSVSGLIDAGQHASIAGNSLNQAFASFAKLRVDTTGVQSQENIFSILQGARGEINNARYELQTVSGDLKTVSVSDLPEQYRSDYIKYSSTVDVAVDALEHVSDLIGLLQNFLGSGQKTVLVLFQNNSELRPTGGFIGTYGFFKINNGRIVSQKISSIYDIDGQLNQKIAPPGPFFELTDHWGLRDSNWFIDFKKSAQKAVSFYEKEGRETPDAVIAITPDVFSDLLSVTGPIDFPKYNVTLDSKNFREQVQLMTSVQYDKSQNTPKQMLSDFAPLLLQKISGLQNAQYTDLVNVVLRNLSQKNILFYDRNPKVQAQLEQNNWAGRIIDTDKDFIQINNANLGGKKTDTHINQTLSVHSEVQPDGSIVNSVTYTRSLEQNLSDASANIDYARFVVPLGSKLLSATGFTKKEYRKSDGTAYVQDPNVPFTVDADLATIDSNTTLDTESGTEISAQNNKTIFANWIFTNPGETSTVSLTYVLPFNFYDGKKYSLVLQKQPGNMPIDLQYALDFKGKILWSTPQDLQKNQNTLKYIGIFNSDMLIGAVFEQ